MVFNLKSSNAEVNIFYFIFFTVISYYIFYVACFNTKQYNTVKQSSKMYNFNYLL